jgi:hypothetical protein
MQNKIIIIATIVFFIIGLVVLFVIESVNHNYDRNKSWSVVYFNNPSDNSLDFTIENHQGENKNYEYSYQVNGDSVNSGEIDVPARGKNTIVLPQEFEMKVRTMKKTEDVVIITIDVKLNDSEYKIYKDIR